MELLRNRLCVSVELRASSTLPSTSWTIFCRGLFQIQTRKVLPQVSEFASKKFPELFSKAKKEEIDLGGDWSSSICGGLGLKEFKVGIINAPPMSDGPQLVSLDNIKKL